MIVPQSQLPQNNIISTKAIEVVAFDALFRGITSR
jgi:hypothetical protein